MHFRGFSGLNNRLARSYHSGDTEDFSYLITTLQRRYSGARLDAVGFSLGGNVLLKFLGEAQDQAPLAAAVASAEAKLEAVLANSRAAPRWNKQQWIVPIEGAQKRADTRAAFGSLLAQSPRAGEANAWREHAVIGMQGLALVVLQLTGILCIVSLRAGQRQPSDPIIVASAATDALLPDPKPVRRKVSKKRKALGRGLQAGRHHC